MRLARMICADASELAPALVIDLARQFATFQENKIATAVRRVSEQAQIQPEQIIVTGQADFLVERVLQQCGYQETTVFELSSLTTEAISRCGPAYALAVLLKRISLNQIA